MAEPLRIAQIAPIALPVRSDSEGSIEQVVWLLCEELVRRGHEVTLFATGDSETSARLVHSYGRGYEHDEQLWDWRLHESVHAAAAFERASEFDVIHSHAYCFALPFTRLVPTPTAHTYHVEVDPDVVATFRRYPEACVVALSEWQRSNFGDLPRAEVIRHGIDVEAFPFGPEAGDYLLFLGRMIEDKGPVEAIELARSVGLRLVLAGPGEDWFEREVRPYVDGHEVQYAGPVDHVARNRLLSAAAALVLPLKYPEPFGLVMLEAMACGTPVVATALGAVPEIVEDGVTGFAAGSIAGLRDRVAAALALDRHTIRARARERFGYARMADEHELLYRRLAAGGSGG